MHEEKQAVILIINSTLKNKLCHDGQEHPADMKIEEDWAKIFLLSPSIESFNTAITVCISSHLSIHYYNKFP